MTLLYRRAHGITTRQSELPAAQWRRCQQPERAMDLDKIDVKILSLLQRQARMSNAKLAAAVNLSQSACLARVKRLETAGYIRGYAALLDLEKLGASVTVIAAITL